MSRIALSRFGDGKHIFEHSPSELTLQLLHVLEMLPHLEAPDGLLLEEHNQILPLCLLEDLCLQEFEYSHAKIHLVVNAEHNTYADVMTQLLPVQIVPEALPQPLLADLAWGVARHLEGRVHMRHLLLKNQLDVVASFGEDQRNATGHELLR